MRKILARLAQGDSDEGFTSYNNLGNHQSPQLTSVGRNFRLGSFSLVVETIIAEGGFGVVFRVVSQHGHTYALKRTCVNNTQDLAVCKREITIVSSVSHKNILRYVDSKISDIQPGIYEALLLTSYYPGNLSQLINERKQNHQRFTQADVLRIFGDICEAVCRLHHCKTPIIHRDLKIENILIDDRSNFVLCDFGSATSRVLHPGVHGLTRCEEEISRYTTLAYRAPEMVSLSTSIPLGPQIDIWALGCLLYCLCFFNLPFGDSILAIQSGYILCVDAFKRPDIFQVCALVFTLSGRNNPAQNLNNLPVPLWKDLSIPPRESQLKSFNSLHNSELKSTNRPISPATNTQNKSCSPDQKQSIQSIDQHSLMITNTSVAPRERPRPNCFNHPSHSVNNNRVFGNTVNQIVVEPPGSGLINSNINFTDLPDPSVLGTDLNQNVSTVSPDPFSRLSTNVGWPTEFSNNQFNSQSDEPGIIKIGGHQRTQSSSFVQYNQTASLPDANNSYQLDSDASLFGGHRRCPSDTSSFLKVFSSSLRHAHSLASLSQTSQSYDSIAGRNLAVKYTNVSSVLSSVKQTEIPTSQLPNIVNHSNSINTAAIVSHISSGNREFPLPLNSSSIPSTLSSSTCCTQDVHCNRIITTNDSSTVDDDILFGVAFDAIRSGISHKTKL
ncbi:unnamed protein product [Heterobilharzia americana]|nr:unnamed protein product [Heterobilharzia americana]